MPSRPGATDRTPGSVWRRRRGASRRRPREPGARAERFHRDRRRSCRSAVTSLPASRPIEKPRIAGLFRSRPVSRILSWTAIHLCGRPGPRRAACKRSCLALHRVGFAQPPRRRDAGALLPHHFNLACAELCRGSAIGGVFLWHFPAGFPGSVSRPPCPVVSGLSSTGCLSRRGCLACTTEGSGRSARARAASSIAPCPPDGSPGRSPWQRSRWWRCRRRARLPHRRARPALRCHRTASSSPRTPTPRRRRRRRPRIPWRSSSASTAGASRRSPTRPSRSPGRPVSR